MLTRISGKGYSFGRSRTWPIQATAGWQNNCGWYGKLTASARKGIRIKSEHDRRGAAGV